jgi:hypothetical protein
MIIKIVINPADRAVIPSAHMSTMPAQGAFPSELLVDAEQ